MKQRASNLEAIDIVKLADQLVQSMSVQAWQGSRVLIVLDAARPEIWALADGKRLQQVLIHLLHNAVRHTPPGGVVVVSLLSRLEGIFIKIQDSGDGIHADSIASIWKPSVHGDNQVHGMGFGLSVVKRFIEAMRGKIAVASTLGEGTCFTIILPHPQQQPNAKNTI